VKIQVAVHLNNKLLKRQVKTKEQDKVKAEQAILHTSVAACPAEPYT